MYMYLCTNFYNALFDFSNIRHEHWGLGASAKAPVRIESLLDSLRKAQLPDAHRHQLAQHAGQYRSVTRHERHDRHERYERLYTYILYTYCLCISCYN